VVVGTKLAGDLHPVANPAFDPGDGSLYVTRSGARGEHVPVSLYELLPRVRLKNFSGDITNPDRNCVFAARTNVRDEPPGRHRLSRLRA
jgi:hypothetical protein